MGKEWTDIPSPKPPAPPSGANKSWNQQGAVSRRAGGNVGPVAPPVVPNSGGNYSRPSAPPSGGAGPISNISAPPNINAYLGGDTTYQQQQQNFQKTLADFLSNEKLQKSKLTEDYGGAQRAMNLQKTNDLSNMQQDFAGRGLLTSGLYAGAVGDYNTDFLQKLAELTKNFKRSTGDLSMGETNFRKEQQLAAQRAREEALARRASQYGI